MKPTFDGRPASAGNGAMIAFEARAQQQVRDLHAAALLAGGRDEGPPGFRPCYGPHFYVSYLRDPQGNKIALFPATPMSRGATRADSAGGGGDGRGAPALPLIPPRSL